MEIKQANSIYNEQDFHARKKVKIPVHQHSAIWEKFDNRTGSVKLNIEKSRHMHRSRSEGSLKQMREDLMYKQESELQLTNEPSNNLSYMNGYENGYNDDDDNDDDEYNNGIEERQWLLNSRPKVTNNKNATNNLCEEYLELVDKDIQHISNRVQLKTDAVDIGAHTLAYMQPSTTETNNNSRLGQAGWVNYKGILVVVCTVGVILPTMYVLYFLLSNKDS